MRFAADIADLENIAALTWGDEDLVAAIGGRSSRFDDGRFSDFARFARSQVLIAAASASKVAYDTAHLNISDVDGLRDEAEDAAASGFVGALCIHPSQVEIVRAAFRPGDADVERARAVLAAAEASPNSVFSFQGRMIDEPILRQARHIDEASR
ncbi:MAG: aldolase/citrate lyase family protein [Actinomycetota bacterium]